MRKFADLAPFAAAERIFFGAPSPATASKCLVAARRALALAVFAAVGAMPAAVLAQGAPPSRPTDVDPAVNTSSPEQAPARETQRPQDINPGVNTSSPSQTPASPSTSVPSAAAPANAAGSASSPTAPAARSTTVAKPAGSATAPGAASTATGAATQNAPGTKPKGKALDRLELDTTQITGNRELPKVLYIVPWKRSDLGDLVGKPVNSLLDEVLTPVDRDVFKRENRYYRALTPAPAVDNVGSTPAPAPATGNANPASTSGGSAAPASRDER